jgi:GTP pyrophosphokinase
MTKLTERFRQALGYAVAIHDGQPRNGTEVPYASHLLAVSSLVLEQEGSEDEAIGALLHDAVEDGKASLAKIRERYGDDVATIVAGCTDSHETPKRPWKERKVRYLAHLREAPRSTRLVAAADKLHNARCILADYRIEGERLWTRRFEKSRADILWYYRGLIDALRRREPEAGDALVEELGRVVGEIEKLAKSEDQD